MQILRKNDGFKLRNFYHTTLWNSVKDLKWDIYFSPTYFPSSMIWITCTLASFKLILFASCSLVKISGYCDLPNASSNASSCALENVVRCRLLMVLSSSSFVSSSSCFLLRLDSSVNQKYIFTTCFINLD